MVRLRSIEVSLVAPIVNRRAIADNQIVSTLAGKVDIFRTDRSRNTSICWQYFLEFDPDFVGPCEYVLDASKLSGLRMDEKRGIVRLAIHFFDVWSQEGSIQPDPATGLEFSGPNEAALRQIRRWMKFYRGFAMAKGDHLVVQYGPYTHHGIELDDGSVIHYGRGLHNKINARVEVVDRETFAGDNPVRVSSVTATYSPDEILERAKSRLGENNYDLFENNCEHFVNWCRQGVANSSQVNIADSVCRRSSAAVVKLAFPRIAGRFAVRNVATKFASRFGSFGLPAALAGDAVQLSAEAVAIHYGKDRQEIRDIGRRSGALASSGIGYMLGGPAGAAVGFSSWLFGEVVGQTATTTTRRAAQQLPQTSTDDSE